MSRDRLETKTTVHTYIFQTIIVLYELERAINQAFACFGPHWLLRQLSMRVLDKILVVKSSIRAALYTHSLLMTAGRD